MKKLLIISPHFPPVNAPDMQRVRLALPYLRDLGWEPTVLAIDPSMIEGAVCDPLLLKTFPSDIRVIHSRGLDSKWTRFAGIGNLWFRCGRDFTRLGEELLKKERFDLALISTTQFAAFQLGPRWRKRFGLPYVLDYQDPWINPYYKKTGTPPPGGWLKFSLSQWEAKLIEPKALRMASGIISVSDAYGRQLAESYPWFDPKTVQFLPFGASPKDFEALKGYKPEKPLIDFCDGRCHMVYTGRCGPDMRIAMTTLFTAFSRFRTHYPDQAEQIRFHFIGTDYAPPPLGKDWAMPVARAVGVEHFVNEHCYRVPYFDALYYLKNASALVAVGSNDSSYSPSKFYSYVLAERPLLMIFHRDGPILSFAREINASLPYGFASMDDVEPLATSIYESWFVGKGNSHYVPYNQKAFERFTALNMTKSLVVGFDQALQNARST